jgi:hypothetical protein
LNDKYLGLPATLGLEKSDRSVNYEAYEILIKSVAQAIPTYTMSAFQIPEKICKGITYAISRFWWGDDATHKRMH